MRISWSARKTNEWVLQKIGKATLLNSINRRKLSFIGHVARSEGLENDILSGMVSGKRRRERPRRKLLKMMLKRSWECQCLVFYEAQETETPGIRPLRVPRRVSTDPSVPDYDEE
eukprot:gene14557-biopygen4321